MIVFADCQDIRKMAVIKEIDCPKCGAKMELKCLNGIIRLLVTAYVINADLQSRKELYWNCIWMS